MSGPGYSKPEGLTGKFFDMWETKGLKKMNPSDFLDILKQADSELATLKALNGRALTALIDNHSHYHYSDIYITKYGVPNKVDCKHCQLIAELEKAGEQ